MSLSETTTTNSINLSDYDAERTLISCTRESSDASYAIFAKAIDAGVTSDHFSDGACSIWWKCLCKAEAEGDFGDLGAYQRLPKTFNEEYPHFTEHVLLSHDVASEYKSDKAIQRIVQCKHYREIDRIAESMKLEVADSDPLADPISLAHKAEQNLQKIIVPKSSTLADSEKLSDGLISMIDRAMEDGPARIEPHLPWLKLCLKGGFKNAQMTVIAARPGVGKTTIALNFIYNGALQGKKTLFFSLEMKGEYLWEKLALIKAGKGLPYTTPNKELNQKNAVILKEYVNQCRNLPIFIDDNGDAKISDIRATAKVLDRKVGLDCIVIDYCTLVKPEDPRVPREQQVAEISRSAKLLSKELDLPVILIAQLNRDSVKKGVEPQLHDLRDSGQIEQDADTVMLLHRDYLKDKEDVKVIVAKQRFGGTGHSRDKIKFKPDSQTFIEVAENRLNEGTRDVVDFNNTDNGELRI
jgi:replicative DNA helicase